MSARKGRNLTSRRQRTMEILTNSNKEIPTLFDNAVEIVERGEENE